jgi:hypothetical protein
MAGIPTKFVVADKVFNAIRSQGGADTDLLNDPNALAFAYLGVIGAGIGDFLAALPDAALLLRRHPISEHGRSDDVFRRVCNRQYTSDEGVYADEEGR